MSQKHFSTECRTELKALVRDQSGRQAHIAELLFQVHDRGYWQNEFSSFADYCERELGMALRTAQEFIRTYRACHLAGITNDEIERTGWSKVAKIASRLRSENKEQLLKDAADLSHRALSQKYGKASPCGKYTSARSKPSGVCLTRVVLEALARASSFTQSDDPQVNLDYVAERFINDLPRPSVYTNRFSTN